MDRGSGHLAQISQARERLVPQRARLVRELSELEEPHADLIAGPTALDNAELDHFLQHAVRSRLRHRRASSEFSDAQIRLVRSETAEKREGSAEHGRGEYVPFSYPHMDDSSTMLTLLC